MPKLIRADTKKTRKAVYALIAERNQKKKDLFVLAATTKKEQIKEDTMTDMELQEEYQGLKEFRTDCAMCVAEKQSTEEVFVKNITNNVKIRLREFVICQQVTNGKQITKQFTKRWVLQMFKQLSPCKDCKCRYEACHDSCKVFKEWKDYFDTDKRKYQADKEKQRQAKEVVRNACNNMRTRKASNNF